MFKRFFLLWLNFPACAFDLINKSSHPLKIDPIRFSPRWLGEGKKYCEGKKSTLKKMRGKKKSHCIFSRILWRTHAPSWLSLTLWCVEKGHGLRVEEKRWKFEGKLKIQSDIFTRKVEFWIAKKLKRIEAKTPFKITRCWICCCLKSHTNKNWNGNEIFSPQIHEKLIEMKNDEKSCKTFLWTENSVFLVKIFS